MLTGKSYWAGGSLSSYLWILESTDAALVSVISRALLRFLSPRTRVTGRGETGGELEQGLVGGGVDRRSSDANFQLSGLGGGVDFIQRGVTINADVRRHALIDFSNVFG